MTLKTLFIFLASDFRRDSFYVGRSKIAKVIFCSISIRAILIFRISHYLYLHKRIAGSYYLQRLNLSRYGIDISPSASIGPGLKLLHTSGTVIGAGVVIGANCTLLHGVTLGVRNVLHPALEGDFPKIGSNVTLATNTCLFGRVQLIDNTFVPANSTLIERITGDNSDGTNYDIS